MGALLPMPKRCCYWGRLASARPIWQWRSGARRSSPAIRRSSFRRRPWWPNSPRRIARAGWRTPHPFRQAQAADRRRARLPAVRAQWGASVLSARLAALRAGRHVDHQQSLDQRVGNGIWRRRGGDRHPRPPPPSQSRHYHSRGDSYRLREKRRTGLLKAPVIAPSMPAQA